MTTAPSRTIDLTAAGGQYRIALSEREGAQPPIIFLHGFGGTKEDYADAVLRPKLAEHRLLAWDAPGHGESSFDAATPITVDLMADIAFAMLEQLSVDRFHLAGHSMGGLAALLLAEKCGERLLSFLTIEGNLAPEDCTFSRQWFAHPASGPAQFLDGLAKRIGAQPLYGNALYAANLRSRVDPAIIGPLFTSLVEHSDHGRLLDRFLALACPRLFIYGEQNSFSYLGALEAPGVTISAIADSAHFPMYSNPSALWRAIECFIAGLTERTAL